MVKRHSTRSVQAVSTVLQPEGGTVAGAGRAVESTAQFDCQDELISRGPVSEKESERHRDRDREAR